MSFVNKVILVTGASSGIGRATAIKFARSGANLTLIGRDVNNLEECRSICEKESGIKPQIINADLSVEDQAKTVVPKTIERWNKLDVLVNSAGIMKQDSILSNNFSHVFNTVMAANLNPAVILTNTAAPYLIKSKGCIVNVSSAMSMLQSPTSISYCVVKSALDQFTKCTALALASKGVRVNAVNPGPVKTNMLERSNFKLPIPVHDFYKTFGGAMPLQRVSESDEVADLIIYLASVKASSITGVTYPIDCGYLLKQPNF